MSPGPLARWLARRRRRQGRLALVHHEGYRLRVPGVPLDPLRGERILAFLEAEGLARRDDVVRPEPASLRQLGRVHLRSYLEALDDPRTVEPVLGFVPDTAMLERALTHQRLITGGTIAAARLALAEHRAVANLGGGLHHAEPGRGMGLCLFNDVAVAVAVLRARGFEEAVLVVDLDVHDGNGTRVAFRADPTVHTLSIHNRTWEPAPAVADTSIELGADVDDRRYLDTVRRELPPVLEAFRPRLCFYLAGADAAADDPVGDWRVSEDGLARRDRYVLDALGIPNPGAVPTVILLAGGYGPRAWRPPARTLGRLLAGRDVAPGEGIGGTLALFRRVEPPGAEDDEGGASWALSEEDLGLAPAAERAPRVLGELSPHAVELSLERVGILDAVRGAGYPSAALEVEASPPLGHTVRLRADSSPGAPRLMELRVNRSRTLLPGFEVAYVEWLLLQNPRRAFEDGRQPLPGQRHPGLGLLREVVAWLVVVCERLRLDGVAFVASHYYMAALGSRHLRFVDAADAALFEALRDALEGLPLAEASYRLQRGEVLDPRTGQPIAWPAPAMVLPVSERLARATSSPAS